MEIMDSSRVTIADQQSKAKRVRESVDARIQQEFERRMPKIGLEPPRKSRIVLGRR